MYKILLNGKLMMNNIFSTKHMLKPELVRGDLPTTKEAYSNLMRMALPSVIEMVLSSLIGSVDTMMVGTLGSAAIAAVGLTGQPRMIVLAVFFALNIGVTAVIARRKGEERQEDAKATLKNILMIMLLLSLILTVLAIIFARPLMRLAGAIEGETLEMSVTYFSIIIAGAPINALTMAINAAQRGVGNTKITMIVNTVSNIFNVIFNYLLIGGNFGFPQLGVAGAAIASCIGFFVGFLLSLISVCRPDCYLKLDLKSSWKPRKEILRPVISVGSNAVFEQIALRTGFFLFARIVADLGTDNYAAHQIAMQFMTITFTFGDGIGVAGTSLVGQNLGRERPDISILYGKIAQRVALCVSFAIFGLLIIFRVPLVSLFSKEAHIIELSANLLILLAAIQIFQTSSTVITGCLRGSGDTKFVAIVMIICVTLIRPLFAYTAIHILHLGLYGAWISTLIDIGTRMVCVYTRFARSKWINIKV